MKKKIIGIVLCMLMLVSIVPVTSLETTQQSGSTTSMIMYDLMRPSGKESTPVPQGYQEGMVPASTITTRGNYPAPDYQFIKNPTTIMTSFYDYMPGGYTTHPIKLQTDHGNGEYLTFHAKATTTGTRRQYYTYVNNTYVMQTGTINPVVLAEGYGSLVIHAATGDPIASWHEATGYTTRLTYDNFYPTGTPGHWQSPVTIPTTNDMQYIWPVMYLGPSPYGNDYVRVYQVSNNALQTSGGFPCEDVRIMYTDIINDDTADLNDLLNLAYWDTVTVFTSWRDKSCRPFQSFAIDYNTPGRVAFIGDAAWLEGDLGDMPVDEGAFVWESLDYGETWDVSDLYSDGPGAALYQVENPGFEEAPELLDVGISGWHNTALYDSEGNLHWTYMQQYGYSDSGGSYYFPYFLPQAEMVWDGTSFTFHEVPELPGIDSYSGHSVPWIETTTYPVITWSTYPAADAGIFHENNQKQAINVDNNWIAQVWVDGTKATLGADGEPEYLEYVEHPIIFIAVSPDNGRTWTEPVELTDINSELFDFSEQITVYPYVCDQITDLGNRWGRVDLMYMDDNTFGSYIQGVGGNTGGQITYSSVKILWPEPGELSANADGPYSAYVGEDIQFVGSAVGGKPPYVSWYWNFGDGTTASVRNPKKNYTAAGVYPVTLTVTDDLGAYAVADTTATITIELIPMLEIGILGGGLKKVSAEIKSVGNTDAVNVTWMINVTGNGILRKIIVVANGTISALEPDAVELKVAQPVYGFAKLDITVSASAPGCDPVEKKATAFVFFVWVTSPKEV